MEEISKINYQLERDFGKWPDGRPNWRVVWSEDMYEQRWMDCNDAGIELPYPEVRQVPKYQHVSERYVLERLVPVVGETDLITQTSYEPVWVFQDNNGNYLPPRFDACKFIIEAIYAQIDKAGTHVKYKKEGNTEEEIRRLTDEVKAMLFGNETTVGDALAHKYGVTDFHEKVKFNESNS